MNVLPFDQLNILLTMPRNFHFDTVSPFKHIADVPFGLHLIFFDLNTERLTSCCNGSSSLSSLVAVVVVVSAKVAVLVVGMHILPFCELILP